MPAGLSKGEFVLSLVVAFGSAFAGSCVMHRILRPDMNEPDVLDRVKSQRAAIKAVQLESAQRHSNATPREATR